MTIDHSIVEEFFIEAAELLDELEECCLLVERDAEDPQEHLKRLFRILHTIKGTAAVTGLQAISNVSHQLEQILTAMQKGQVPITGDLMQIFLEYKDWVRDALTLETCQPEQQHMMEKMSTIMNRDSAPKAEANVAAAAPKAAPAAQTAPPQAQVTPEPLPKSRLPVTILVVDDEEGIRELLNDGLSQEGYEVIVAENGQEALDKFRQNRIDLIVTDYSLPIMTGKQFAKEVRTVNESIPIIFISGVADRKDLVDFLSMHVFDFFEKPFDLEHLYAVVARAAKTVVVQRLAEEMTTLNFRTFIELERILPEITEQSLQTRMQKVSQYLQKVRDIASDILKVGP